ncbi:hypothetical protein [Serinibacter salmoneus]|uniref:Uncharacterized protein n=1 Tax=Serinibacter salmoneus TaxID=556530 RepID=A0A2A9D1T6_9MICO|nr:hypothetical protein [Serinibacter salmoneus]PFG19912.1 hypothetical protein ATL40_1489 [Serinibacter salmoneus]
MSVDAGRRRTRRVVIGTVGAFVLTGAVGLAIADNTSGPDLGPPASAQVSAPASLGDPAAAEESQSTGVSGDLEREPGAPLPTSAAGNVVKRIGESAMLLDASGAGSAAFQITLHEATAVASCPGRLGSDITPESGAFLVLDVSAEMDAEIEGSLADVATADILLPLGADAFVPYDPEGAPMADSASASAWSCYEDSDLLPPFIGPGESYRGLVVLDALDAASVAYQPGGAEGWEWSLPG